MTNDPNGDPIYNKVHKARAYGEDDSVFITVETDLVSANPNDNAGVTKAITDVKGVYTGVQNVELISESSDRIAGTTKATSHPSTPQVNPGAFGERVYTVYDKDHFIIGSVILGSAKGGVENYAYILNPVKSEERRDGDGYYYWEFEAVLKGEIVTLTAKTKYENTILTLKDNRYKIVELRMDGEYVTSVAELDEDDIYGKNASGYGAGQGFNEIKANINNENVYDVILDNDSAWTVRTGLGTLGRETVSTTAADPNGSVLYLQGNTLYVLADRSDVGLALSKDAKAVVRQVEAGDWKNTEFTSVDSAVAWLADADNNPDNGKQFHGVITAVLNSKGVAEWVVFYTDTELVAGANRDPNTPASGMKANIWVRYNGGTYTQLDTVTISKPVVDGTPASKVAPSWSDYPQLKGWKGVPIGGASTTTQYFLYEANKTVDLYFDYVNRTPTGLSVTAPTGNVEVVYNGSIVLADLRAAAGFKVEATFDNGETVDVTSSVNTTLTSTHTTLIGGASAAATISAAVQYSENGTDVTDTETVNYINYATVANTTTVALAGDCANLTTADWTADFVGNVPAKIKAGDTISVLVSFKNDTDTTDASGATWTATLTGATLSITKGTDVVYTAGASGEVATYAVTIHVTAVGAASTTGNIAIKEAT